MKEGIDMEITAENSEITARKTIGRPFRPGISGNPGGRPRRRLVDLALDEQLAADNYAKAVAIAKALIDRAISGDVQAAKLIAERTEGKPTQKVEHSGRDGEPSNIIVTFVSGTQ